MLAYNVHSGWSTLSALATKFGQQPTPGDEPVLQLQRLGALALVALVALGGGEETFGGSNVVQAVLLAGSLVVEPAIVVMLAECASAPLWRSRALATGLLLLTTALNTLTAHAGTRYLVPLILAACGLCGALPALLAERLPQGRLLLLGVCALAFGTPNLAGYARIADLMAPEQSSYRW